MDTYLLEASAVGEVKREQRVGLDEDMLQLWAAIKVEVRQLWASCCWRQDRLADIDRAPHLLQINLFASALKQ